MERADDRIRRVPGVLCFRRGWRNAGSTGTRGWQVVTGWIEEARALPVG